MSFRYCTAVLLSVVALQLQAAGFETFNQSSLARAAPLPVLGQPPVLQPGVAHSSVVLDWSNAFYQRRNTREQLELDGESLRLALRHQQGFELSLGRALEWSVELPLLFTGGGLQDSAIEGWHEAFGLPNGNREKTPSGQYRLRYVRDGVTLLDIDQGHAGLGDARLGLGLQLTPHWAVRGHAQLPTGSRRHLTGGHAGAALWTDFTLPFNATGRAALTLSGGVALTDRGGALSDQQRSSLGLMGAVLKLPLFGALDGIVQVNGHSPLYQGSALAPLAKTALPLSIGLGWPWRGLRFQLALNEDVSVNASPDFALLLSVRRAQGAGASGSNGTTARKLPR